MNVQELLSYQLSDEEKYKSDLANMILVEHKINIYTN